MFISLEVYIRLLPLALVNILYNIILFFPSNNNDTNSMFSNFCINDGNNVAICIIISLDSKYIILNLLCCKYFADVDIQVG